MDARLAWGADGADLVLEAGDLAHEEGLATAVLVSLFSDARSPRDPADAGVGAQPRGWWADAPGDRLGSLLWTLERAKATVDLPARAREAVLEALAWLLEEGIASSVEVEAEMQARGVLAIEVRPARGPARRWADLWRATALERLRQGSVFLQLAPT